MTTIDINSAASTGRSVAQTDLMLAWTAAGEVRADTLREVLSAGFQTQIVNSADLDNLLELGMHVAAGPSNRPAGRGNAVIMVARGALSNEYIQEWIGIDGQDYWRTTSDGGSTWTDWTARPSEIASEAQVINGSDRLSALTPEHFMLAVSQREREHVRDIDLSSAMLQPRGLASYGGYIHLFDGSGNAYAYDASTLARASGEDFVWDASATVSYGATSRAGNYYVCVDAAIRAYDTTASYARKSADDPGLHSSNSKPRALVYDDTGAYWCVDDSRRVYRYSSLGVRDSASEWQTHTSNNAPRDAWYDGANMWVLDASGRVYCYDPSDGTRRISRELQLPGENSYGIWSDGERSMWVSVDANATSSLQAYYLPGGVRPIGAATTEQEGIVQRATTAIARAGVDTELYISSALAVEIIRAHVTSATTTAEGLVRLPTSAEVTAGTTTSAVPTVADVTTMIGTPSSPGTGTTVGTASTTSPGITRYSTRTETSGQTEENAAVTPVSLKDYVVAAHGEIALDATHFVPRGIAVDGDNVYMLGSTSSSNSAPDRLYRYDRLTGKLVRSAATEIGNAGPYDLTVHGGLVYVGGSTSTIYAYNGSTLDAVSANYFTAATLSDDITGVASATELLTLDNADRRVYIYNLGTRVHESRFTFISSSTARLNWLEATGTTTSTTEYFVLQGRAVYRNRRSNLLAGATKLFDLFPQNSNPSGIAYDPVGKHWLILDSADRLVYSYDETTYARLAPGRLVAASESTPGVQEIASLSEVITGVDRTKSVSPYGLSSRSASTARTGLVRLETPTETQTGTSTTTATNAASLKAALDARLVNSVGFRPADFSFSAVPNAMIDFDATDDMLWVLSAGQVEGFSRATGNRVHRYPLESAQTDPRGIAVVGDYIMVLEFAAAAVNILYAYAVSDGTYTSSASMARTRLQSGNTAPMRVTASESLIYISDQDNIVYAYTRVGFLHRVSSNITITQRPNVPGGRGIGILEWQGVEHLSLLESKSGTYLTVSHRLSDDGFDVSASITNSAPIMGNARGMAITLGTILIGDVPSSGAPVFRVFNPTNLQHQAAGHVPYSTTEHPGLIEIGTDTEVSDRLRRDVALTPRHLQDIAATTTKTGLVRRATSSEAIDPSETEPFMSPSEVATAITDREHNWTEARRSGTGITDITQGLPLSSAMMQMGYEILRLTAYGTDIAYPPTLEHIGGTHGMTSLAIRPGTLEAWTNNGGRIARVDLFSGAVTNLDSLLQISETIIVALAWHNTNLYGLGGSGRLFQINDRTGSATYIGSAAIIGASALASNGTALHVWGNVFAGAPRIISTTDATTSAVTGRVNSADIQDGIVSAFMRDTRPTSGSAAAPANTLIGFSTSDSNLHAYLVGGRSAGPQALGALTLPSGFNAADVQGMSVGAGGVVYVTLSQGTTRGGLYRLTSSGDRS